MNFDIYSTDFRQQAVLTGHDDDYVTRCLAYASRLNDKGLPVIYDGRHFCGLVGYETNYVYGASNAPTKFYRSFLIRKRNGGERQISEPLPSLKEIQRWILENILVSLPVSRFAKGFVKGESTKTGARLHRRTPLLLNLDLQDFFPSINYPRVEKIFVDCGYTKSVVGLLTHLCLLEGGLPQGAPTSPALSNLVLKEFDEKIGEFCVERHIRYSRYADDLSFSGDFEVREVIRHVKENLSPLYLKVKKDKTRVLSQGDRQEVTGIVVNDQLRAPRELRRQLRQSAHFIEKFGLDYHLATRTNNKRNAREHLIGLAKYALHIYPKDRDALYLLAVLDGEATGPP